MIDKCPGGGEPPVGNPPTSADYLALPYREVEILYSHPGAR